MDYILYNYFIAYKINEIAKKFFLELLLQDKEHQTNRLILILKSYLKKFRSDFCSQKTRFVFLDYFDYLFILSWLFKVKVKEVKLLLLIPTMKYSTNILSNEKKKIRKHLFRSHEEFNNFQGTRVSTVYYDTARLSWLFPSCPLS